MDDILDATQKKPEDTTAPPASQGDQPVSSPPDPIPPITKPDNTPLLTDPPILTPSPVEKPTESASGALPPVESSTEETSVISTNTTGVNNLPPPPPPTPPMQTRKTLRRIPILITLLLLILTLPVTVFYLSQNKQIADLRNRAYSPEPCLVCTGTKCEKLLSPPDCNSQFDECTSEGEIVGQCGFNPYCDASKINFCVANFARCEPDPQGGHCVDITTPTPTLPPTPYCDASKINFCVANFARCEPDFQGGQCETIPTPTPTFVPACGPGSGCRPGFHCIDGGCYPDAISTPTITATPTPTPTSGPGTCPRIPARVCADKNGTEGGSMCTPGDGGFNCRIGQTNYCCYGDAGTAGSCRLDGACYQGSTTQVRCEGGTITNNTSATITVNKYTRASGGCPSMTLSGNPIQLGQGRSISAGNCEQVDAPGYCGQCNESCGGGGGNPTPTPTGVIAQCLRIKVYKDNQVVQNLATLRPGDNVVLSVAGSNATKGRIRVNGATWTESTTRNTAGEFTVPFTIPATITSFSVEAEVFRDGVWQ